MNNIIDPDDLDFPEKLREALGIKPGDTVELIGPQFTRTDGMVVPTPQMAFEKLHELPDETLKAIGCQCFDSSENPVLWLFPFEWFDLIPKGFEVTNIFGTKSYFDPEKESRDMRFGALCFGFEKAAVA